MVHGAILVPEWSILGYHVKGWALGLGPTTPRGLAREYHTILEHGAWYLEHLYWLLRSFYIMNIM